MNFFCIFRVVIRVYFNGCRVVGMGRRREIKKGVMIIFNIFGFRNLKSGIVIICNEEGFIRGYGELCK